ncbi:MAG: A24 family peptidase [Gemmatimonadota bacterium]
MDTQAIALIVMVAAAAALDVGTRRIPNLLTVSGFTLALVLRGMSGTSDLGSGLLGAALAFALSFPLFIAGGMGGGDVKLLTAVGAFLGPGQLIVALLATAVIGGLLGLIAAIRGHAVKETIVGTGRLLRDLILKPFRPGHPVTLPKLGSPGAITVPYGVAIAAGAVAGLLL